MKTTVKITILTLFLCTTLNVSAQKLCVVKKDANGITFVVDENLPKPEISRFEKHAREKKWNGETFEKWVMDRYGLGDTDNAFLYSSFRDEHTYRDVSKTPMFDAFIKAYAGHKPLVLSPDMIWLTIAQGFCHYVNKNAEALRDKIVSHTGKKTLIAFTGEDLIEGNPDWSEILSTFETEIRKNTKGKLADNMVANFSTTQTTERIASEITLMSSVKNYFDYDVIMLSCGIPYITLQGTTKDWQKVYDKAAYLRQYGLDWWIDDLLPVLKQFVEASKGNVNQTFWQGIVRKVRTDALSGGVGCGGGYPDLVDGWFLHFFPYDLDGKTPSAVEFNMDYMLPELCVVDFNYKITDEAGHIIKETPMEFWAGIYGYTEDSVTCAVTPQIGWLVRVSDKEQKATPRRKKRHHITPEQLEKMRAEDESSIGNDEIGTILAPIDDTPEDSPVSTPDTLKIYDVAELMPMFPGGTQALKEYIDSHLNYPAEAKANGIQGRATVQFVIERDGSISHAKILKPLDPLVDEEAIRVIKSMPKWIPGRQNGIAVRVKYFVPVPFRL